MEQSSLLKQWLIIAMLQCPYLFSNDFIFRHQVSKDSKISQVIYHSSKGKVALTKGFVRFWCDNGFRQLTTGRCGEILRRASQNPHLDISSGFLEISYGDRQQWTILYPIDKPLIFPPYIDQPLPDYHDFVRTELVGAKLVLPHQAAQDVTGLMKRLSGPRSPFYAGHPCHQSMPELARMIKIMCGGEQNAFLFVYYSDLTWEKFE